MSGNKHCFTKYQTQLPRKSSEDFRLDNVSNISEDFNMWSLLLIISQVTNNLRWFRSLQVLPCFSHLECSWNLSSSGRFLLKFLHPRRSPCQVNYKLWILVGIDGAHFNSCNSLQATQKMIHMHSLLMTQGLMMMIWGYLMNVSYPTRVTKVIDYRMYACRT